MNEPQYPRDWVTEVAVLKEHVRSLEERVTEAIVQGKADRSEIVSAIKLVETQVRVQNGAVADLHRIANADEQRWREHLEWSRTQDEKLRELWSRDQERLTIRKVYQQWWIWFIAGAGAIGPAVGGLVYLLTGSK